MDSERTVANLPDVIRLARDGECGCGEPVDAGERTGYVEAQERIVCLHCMARLQARPVSQAQARHTELVAERANGLLSRLIAIKALGTLCSELRLVPGRADGASGATATS